MALVGVQALAAALGVHKGTISKRAAAGSIPVAERDGNGFPLFDVDAVRAAWDRNVNPLMRRAGAPVEPPGRLAPPIDADDDAEEAYSERRSPAAAGDRPTSGLLQQQVVERRLRNRRLLRQLGEDEGLFVLKLEVERAVVTMARQTRDGVAGQLADYAAELYAYVAQPRTESELRIWLSEHTSRAFDEVEKTMAAEKGDEFGDGTGAADEQLGGTETAATP